MQFKPDAASVRSLISRRMQISFIVGLLLGILIGWVFSGLVSAVMRFGFAILLLLPLALAIWFWFKVRSARPEGETTMYTWTSGRLPSQQDDIFQHVRRDQERLNDDVIDLEDIRRERKS
jgi:cobalamin biosynthesis protein CobD/CbiB